jgi:uncharacterized zinc-type alcohol dehydrogenase-like protein
MRWILGLLKIDATMVLVGAVEPLKPFHGGNIIMGRILLVFNWEIKKQEMLDFCGEHNITSDIELIDMQDINKAYGRVTSNDVNIDL